jgi:septum formation protein
MNTLLNWYDRPIILASQSPRRKEILDMIALPYKIHIPEYEENNSSQDIPSQIVLKHALHKAQAVAPFYTKAWIIGADTIVVCDNQILGKRKMKVTPPECFKPSVALSIAFLPVIAS